MDAIEALVDSLPARADLVRQRFWHDPTFRTVCEDYRDALAALARLQAYPAADAARIEEYRQLVAELLAEAAKMTERDRM